MARIINATLPKNWGKVKGVDPGEGCFHDPLGCKCIKSKSKNKLSRAMKKRLLEIYDEMDNMMVFIQEMIGDTRQLEK